MQMDLSVIEQKCTEFMALKLLRTFKAKLLLYILPGLIRKYVVHTHNVLTCSVCILDRLFLTKYHSGDQNKKIEMGGLCSMYAGE
jgi:hypothetical protein